MLAKPGSDPPLKRKNKQHTNTLFEKASASIGPDTRCSYLVYGNAELSDHPEYEALIISSFPPLRAAYVVLQLVLLNMRLCRRSSHCLPMLASQVCTRLYYDI